VFYSVCLYVRGLGFVCKCVCMPVSAYFRACGLACVLVCMSAVSMYACVLVCACCVYVRFVCVRVFVYMHVYVYTSEY